MSKNFTRRQLLGVGIGAIATAGVAQYAGLMGLLSDVPLAYAGTKTVNVSKDEDGIKYGGGYGQYTAYFNIVTGDGNTTGFCATAWSARPVKYGSRATATEIIDQNSLGSGSKVYVDALKRALYYAPGLNGSLDGPGYKESLWSSIVSDMPGYSGSVKNKAYIAVHILVTYCIWNYRLAQVNGVGEWDAFGWRSACTAGGINGYVSGWSDWCWNHIFKNASGSAWKMLMDQPAPPSDYRVWACLPADWSTTVESAYNQVVVWGEGGRTGKLKIKKTPASAEIDGLGTYNLTGAKYGVYQGSTKKGEITITNAAGDSTELELPAGTYTVNELSAPTDMSYMVDSKSYSVTVLSGKTVTLGTDVEMDAEQPYMPTEHVMGKVDADVAHVNSGTLLGQGDASIENAQFKLEYFDGFFTEAQLAGKTATRAWTLKADANGNIKMDEAHRVGSSPAFYMFNNKVVTPLGTYRLTETVAPTGYDKTTDVKVWRLEYEASPK